METKRFDAKKDQGLQQAFLIPIQQADDRTVAINEFLSIGRDLGNHIILQDPFVSGRHARIERKPKGYILRDLQSRNGTLINGTSVVEAVLKNNDQVLIGETSFLFSHFKQLDSPLQSKNHEWNEQLKRLPAFANTNYTVLIIGPTGSGKEILSRWIHDHSERKSAPFITINCSALSEGLIESELFGHCRGSFTGATNDRKGAFEAARGGTLFLDEIGDLPLSLQPKLLRALENQEIRPVGSDLSIKTNVRVIAATHKNLKEKVLKMNFVKIYFIDSTFADSHLPPLLIAWKISAILYAIGKEGRVGFSFSAIEKLKDYHWPGNIRELKNTILRAAAYFPGKKIQVEDLPAILEKTDNLDLAAFPHENLPPLKALERDLIVARLEDYKGNQRKVAESLRMPKSTLHDKIRAYRINVKMYKPRGRAISTE